MNSILAVVESVAFVGARGRSERASFDTSDEIGLSGPLARLQNVI